MNPSSENLPFHRSLELMSTTDTGLLVIDMQEKLLKLIAGHERVTWNCRRLLDGAKLLGMAIAGTEQYPQGLGPTTPVLAERMGALPAKRLFSARECESIFHDWRDRGIFKVLVCGIEAHVCVQQTVLDLLSEGFRTFVAVDAVGSRSPLDAEVAIRRLNASGATITTTEAALFEWCATASHPQFKAISGLVKETGPGSSS
jgi:nicotinamidase-related amidase